MNIQKEKATLKSSMYSNHSIVWVHGTKYLQTVKDGLKVLENVETASTKDLLQALKNDCINGK